MQSSGCSCLRFGHCSCPAPTAQPAPIPPPCRDLASRTLPSGSPRLTCPAPPPRCSSPSEPAPKSAFTSVLLTSCLQQPTVLHPLPGTGTRRRAEGLTGPAAPPHPADTTLGSEVRRDGATLQHRSRDRGCTRCSKPHREARADAAQLAAPGRSSRAEQGRKPSAGRAAGCEEDGVEGWQKHEMGAGHGCIWHAGKGWPFPRQRGAGSDTGQGTEHRLALLRRNTSLLLRCSVQLCCQSPDTRAAPNAGGQTDSLHQRLPSNGAAVTTSHVPRWRPPATHRLPGTRHGWTDRQHLCFRTNKHGIWRTGCK